MSGGAPLNKPLLKHTNVKSRQSFIRVALPLFDAKAGLDERIEWLESYHAKQATDYSSPSAQLERRRYLSVHPTQIIILKCMDGRIDFHNSMKVVPGVLQPYMNLGGRFDLSWPHLGATIVRAVENAVENGRRTLVMISYHLSASTHKWGCAGFGFDAEKALAFMEELKGQFVKVFGPGTETVMPIVVGYETDLGSIILHSEANVQDRVDIGHLPEGADLLDIIHKLYPKMHSEVVRDLLPLLDGNRRHVSEKRQFKDELAELALPNLEHREWMLGIGSGFQFLHTANQALIVGPFSPDLTNPINIAAGIIKGNMADGRTNSTGFLVMACTMYEDRAHDKEIAKFKAKFLANLARDSISKAHPDMVEKMLIKAKVLSARDWSWEDVPLN